jgi:hypothetical protein
MAAFTRRSVLLILVGLILTFSLAYQEQPALAGVPSPPTRFDDPSPDGCLPNDCSLREAFISAASNPGPDTISLSAGTYNLSIPGIDEFAGATGDLNVADELTLAGAGAGTTIIDGGGIDRVLFVNTTGKMTVSGVTIQGGQTAAVGGGILNIGTLTVRDSVLRMNTAASGGGMGSGSASGRLTVEDTTFTQNTGDGGGLFLADAGSQATLRNSTISGNSGIVYSGGAHIQSGAAVTLTNVTISANSAPPPSAMTISSDAQVTMTNVTITNNQSTTAFGGSVANYATLNLENTIIQDAETGCYGDGTFQSLGHNIASDGSCDLTAAGDLPMTDAMLGPLADNGGPTQTHAVLAGSPAIDAGDDAACPPLDQRGYGRVGVCDIGAFELGGSEVEYLQGDVNCDDEVNSVDALFILRGVAQIPPPAECLDIAGDVNCDGNRTSVDALGILRHVASLPISRPEGCPDIGTPL